MIDTEYHVLFDDTGKVKVQVKFKDFAGDIGSKRMNPKDIQKLICPIDGNFISEMAFDEWPFEIYRYEIDPLKNILTIRARPRRHER